MPRTAADPVVESPLRRLAGTWEFDRLPVVPDAAQAETDPATATIPLTVPGAAWFSDADVQQMSLLQRFAMIALAVPVLIARTLEWLRGWSLEMPYVPVMAMAVLVAAAVTIVTGPRASLTTQSADCAIAWLLALASNAPKTMRLRSLNMATSRKSEIERSRGLGQISFAQAVKTSPQFMFSKELTTTRFKSF